MKIRLVDMIVISILFVFCVSFPVDLLNINGIAKLLILILLRFVLLIYIVWIMKKSGVNIFVKSDNKKLVLFIPFILAAFSNLSILFFPNEYSVSSPDGLVLFLNIVFHLITAVVEELIFRASIESSLPIKSKLLRIVAASSIFAGFHLLNLVSPNITNIQYVYSVLLQVAYTFGLGLLLGFIYEYSHSIIACISFHFVFNFINTVIYSLFEPLNNYVQTKVLYVCLIVAGLLAIYTALLYIFKLRKDEIY